ncbi:hypothetical protein LCGC14_1886400 [marine sediment metagenome]|uniref:Methyltransferase type 11 domain-containing protein n=1 Tax=marine sediment metagenome TaxID=412755 RepID=A0A0F9G0U5_9ZZZZ
MKKLVIKDIEKRSQFWDKRENRGPIDGSHDLKDSLPYPFSGSEGLFRGRNVLEIGPGRGRQYDYLKGYVKSYSICDISVEALIGEEYIVDIKDRFQFETYDADFEVRFDIVHFWYVLHHILKEEIDQFFDFVYRHLKDKGLVMFNTPQLHNVVGAYTGDGIGTTHFKLSDIIEALYQKFDVKVIRQIDFKSTGYLIIGEKK